MCHINDYKNLLVIAQVVDFRGTMFSVLGVWNADVSSSIEVASSVRVCSWWCSVFLVVSLSLINDLDIMIKRVLLLNL